jgi:hypothetical protein
MTKKPQNVYQFKITLEHIKPAIWRRIQVPETYTFWELHVAIQDAMGWNDHHLHAFNMVNPQGIKDIIGIPYDEGWDTVKTLPGWKTSLAAYFSSQNKIAAYVYDFVDSWEHKIRLEKILPMESGIKYPLCLAGERACPPEDCGGTGGYEEILEIIKDPAHEDYAERMEWLGEEFDSEAFDPASIKFDNPQKRWKFAFHV